MGVRRIHKGTLSSALLRILELTVCPGNTLTHDHSSSPAHIREGFVLCEQGPIEMAPKNSGMLILGVSNSTMYTQ